MRAEFQKLVKRIKEVWEILFIFVTFVITMIIMIVFVAHSSNDLEQNIAMMIGSVFYFTMMAVVLVVLPRMRKRKRK